MNEELKNEMMFAVYDLEMNEDDAISYVQNALENVSYTEAKSMYDEVTETLNY